MKNRGGGGEVGREIWAHGRLQVVTDARESCRVFGSANEGSYKTRVARWDARVSSGGGRLRRGRFGQKGDMGVTFPQRVPLSYSRL